VKTRQIVPILLGLLISLTIWGGSPEIRPLPDFEINQGQFQQDVRFVSRLQGGYIALKNDGMEWKVGQNRFGILPIAILPTASKQASLTGSHQLATVSHYYQSDRRSDWRENVPHFAEVRQQQVWPGIDLRFYFQQDTFEFDVDLAAGADLNQVAFQLTGSKDWKIVDGDLVGFGESGKILLHAPEIFQSGRRIDGSFSLNGDVLRFEVPRYDRKKPLRIDPRVIFLSYVGGGENDAIYGVATDSSRFIYAAGGSASGNLPWGSARASGETSAFIARYESSGRSTSFFTYLGAGEATAVTVTANNTAYVAGYNNVPRTFPVGGGSYVAPNRGGNDVFVVRLRSDGTVNFGSIIGGSGNEEPTKITVDADGNPIVVGVTRSINFSVTANAISLIYGGGPSDGFVAKLNSTGTNLLFSTFIGGREADRVNGVLVNASGGIVLVGETESLNFPTTSGTVQPNRRPALNPSIGAFDGFVMQINSAGNAIAASTLLGGGRYDTAKAITRDSDGNFIVAGNTQSSDFPFTAGVLKERITDQNVHLFLTRLTPDLTRILTSTALSGVGENQEFPTEVKVDAANNVIVAGAAGARSFVQQQPDLQADGNFWGFVALIRSDFRQISDALVLTSNTVVNAVAFPSGPNPPAATDDLSVVYAGSANDSISFRFPDITINGGYSGERDGFYGRVVFNRPVAPPVLGLAVRTTPTLLTQFTPFNLVYEVQNGFATPVTTLSIRIDRAISPVVSNSISSFFNRAANDFAYPINDDFECAFAAAANTGFTCRLREGRTIAPGASRIFAVPVIEVVAGRFNVTATAEARTSAGTSGSVTTPVTYETAAAPVTFQRPRISAVEFRGRGPVPGGLNTLFGRWNIDPGASTLAVGGQIFPYSANGILVTVNNLPVPVLFANEDQINFYLPPSYPLGPAGIQVIASGVPSEAFRIDVKNTDPYIFTQDLDRCACQNADGNVNNEFTPAAAGTPLVVYFTGGGLSAPPPPNNLLTPGSPLPRLAAGSRALIDGQEATIQYIGFTPGSVGLQQANVLLPANLGQGVHRIEIEVGGRTTNPASFVSRAP
jgi:uncharacterized protein (TIGR03437 family)